MLIGTTGPLHEDLSLLTFGYSCHYVISEGDGYSIIDPGLSIHVPYLHARLAPGGYGPSELKWIFLTHLHPERAAAIPLLRKHAPGAKLAASAAMRAQLQNREMLRSLYEADCRYAQEYGVNLPSGHPSFDEFARGFAVDRLLSEADLIRFDSTVSMRVVAAPGHTEQSLAFYLMPARFLVVDEGFGYYQGRRLSAPGGDASIVRAVEAIDKLRDIEVMGLCFPTGGVITGTLVRRHLNSLKQNSADMLEECAKGYAEGVSDAEIRDSLKEHFYFTELADPIVRNSLERSLAAVFSQVKSFGTQPPVLSMKPPTDTRKGRAIDPSEVAAVSSHVAPDGDEIDAPEPVD